MYKMQIEYPLRNLKEVSKLLRKFDKLDKKQAVVIDAEVERKLKIVRFGLKYGYKATIDAFGIKKSTYYNYVMECKQSKDFKQLKPRSKKPIRVRQPNWNKSVVQFIKHFRHQHANIGKEKIKYYLDQFCLQHNIKTISTGTIRNIINSFPNKLRTKTIAKTSKRRADVLRKPKGYKAKFSGECTSLDSMEFRSYGKKMYIVTATDEATGLLYAEATASHTSKYYRTYPKSPKQNARCERVNRIIQDELMIQHESLLFHDIDAFNRELKSYLHWFNFKRVHARFHNTMTPLQKHYQLQQIKRAQS